MRKFNVLVDGKQYNVEIEELGGSSTATTPTQIAAPAQSAPAAAPAPVVNAGGIAVNSPMPGVIVKLVAANGSVVKKGQVIAVLEAMKMENDIVSPADGKVSFAVAQGANVNSGDALAYIG